MTNFAKIEALFSDLLTSSDVLSEAERGDIQHYIDHNEYGVALELTVGTYAAHRKMPTFDGLRRVKELADEMKMDSAEIMGRLEAFRR